MYFKDKKTTNIDDEFENKDILSNIIQIITKYKIIIITTILLIILLVIVFSFIKKENIINYLEILGNESITIYEDSEYIDPGYKAYNSNNEILTSKVIVNSNLNSKEIGNYEIKYILNNIEKIRKIKVIEKPKRYTYIYLNPIDNDINIYLKLGEKYQEPGFQVFSSSDNDLTNKVELTGNVDINKKGIYILTYSVIDDMGVTVSKNRIVNVLDPTINLKLNTEEFTNNDIIINIDVDDKYFDYMILPNGNKINDNKYTYKVSTNGTYTFKTYNTKGMEKEATIKVNNIDRESPSGTCSIDQNQKGSFITIDAKDNSGIKNYIYNNKAYTSKIINLTTFIDKGKITLIDNANNKKEIVCTVVPKPYISNIEKDGVIIKINAKKVKNNITGYYFSYTNQRPNKNAGGYIKTNKETIDVVRLPGTTYIWVEDSAGKISNPNTITISNDELLIANKDSYKILDTPLSTYLTNKGWSLDELNNLIARSVSAAGLYTKEAAATSAVTLLTVLAQKYNIKLPYWNGGKRYDFGADGTWGKHKPHYVEKYDTWYYYYGLDCSGFTTWAYVSAGYNVAATPNVSIYPAYWWGYKFTNFTKENGQIGDFLVNDGHIKLIVGKTDTAFITAEAKGKSSGMVISIHEYSKPNGYKVQKGEELMNNYNKYKVSEIPTGV